MVDPVSDKVSRASPYSGVRPTKSAAFRLRGSHPLWPAFPCRSPMRRICDFAGSCTSPRTEPTTPSTKRRAPVIVGGFGLFPVRSPLLGESHIDFFSCRYLDGSVPCVSPRDAYLIQRPMTASRRPGYPIRSSADHGICAPPRGFSQLITTFFAVQLRGIHHEPIVA